MEIFMHSYSEMKRAECKLFLQRCDNKETVVKLQLNVSSFELNIKTTALSFLF